MNAREVIEKYRQEVYGDYTDEPEGTGLIARLKAEGLFIGPLVATPEMERSSYFPKANAGSIWNAMVQEWLRTEGA